MTKQTLESGSLHPEDAIFDTTRNGMRALKNGINATGSFKEALSENLPKTVTAQFKESFSYYVQGKLRVKNISISHESSSPNTYTVKFDLTNEQSNNSREKYEIHLDFTPNNDTVKAVCNKTSNSQTSFNMKDWNSIDNAAKFFAGQL